jgi:molybdate transport system substrate-binding protein
MRELALILLAGCAQADRLHVFAAASLEEPVVELAGSGAEVNAAASSVLARQIASGAPADLFVSADRDWVDWLAARTNVEAKSIIAKNRLVLIARRDDPRSAGELLSGRIALADPTHVPAGKYAQAALQRMEADPSIASAGDVRGALALVVRGEVDAGIVYRTDARLAPEVRIVTEIESPIPIECFAALLTERARGVYERMVSEEGRRVFARHGFALP